MSCHELKKYLDGETVVRDGLPNGYTTGPYDALFFFDSEIETSTGSYDPFNAYEFLLSVVSGDFLAEFSANDELMESTGIYADPSKAVGTMIVDERWAKVYNDRCMKLMHLYDVLDGKFEEISLEEAYVAAEKKIRAEASKEAEEEAEEARRFDLSRAAASVLADAKAEYSIEFGGERFHLGKKSSISPRIEWGICGMGIADRPIVELNLRPGSGRSEELAKSMQNAPLKDAELLIDLNGSEYQFMLRRCVISEMRSEYSADGYRFSGAKLIAAKIDWEKAGEKKLNEQQVSGV